MCYSAKIKADYRMFVRDFGATIDLKEFARLYGVREEGSKAKIPKALDAWFADPRLPDNAQILTAMKAYEAAEMTRLEQELFKQKQRLTKANRALEKKQTKKASEERRIATNFIASISANMAELRRPAQVEQSARIYPGDYVPVLVVENGKRIIKPMRYRCRPAGMPGNIDKRFPGVYNARHDNLEGFWRGQFGHTHGIIVATAFYEHVKRHEVEGRDLAEGEKPEDIVLEFKPDTGEDMLVACLWSRWIGVTGEELLSFAAITDEPPAEVAAAGHNRCIIPIQRGGVDKWLQPMKSDLQQLYTILDARQRPYYEHRMAA